MTIWAVDLNVVLRPAASATPGNLWEGPILRPYHGPTEWETEGEEPSNLGFNKPSRRFGCIRSCRNITAAQMLGREMGVVCHRGEVEMAWWSQHQERTTPAEGAGEVLGASTKPGRNESWCGFIFGFIAWTCLCLCFSVFDYCQMYVFFIYCTAFKLP